MGTTAPYLICQRPADHNHSLEDVQGCPCGKGRYSTCISGQRNRQIRKHINKQHILRPAAYAVEQGATGYERTFEGNEENSLYLSENKV